MSSKLQTIILLISILLGAWQFSDKAVAQDAVAVSEDDVRLCPLVPEKLVGLIVSEAAQHPKCDQFCQGCGCKGGPGYRSGRNCVGWKDIIKKCGPPPHAACDAECEPVEPGCPGRAWVKELAAKAGLKMEFIPGNPKNGRD